MTIDNTKNLNLKSFTIDFEKALINAIKKIFKKSRCIGCYYHYSRAIKQAAREMKLLTKDKNHITEKFLNELYLTPFTYYKDNNYLNSICTKYEKDFIFLKDYIAYFKKQWYKFFENGMLDYSNITKGQ